MTNRMCIIKTTIILLLLVAILISFVACNNKKNMNLKYEEGAYYNKDWNETVGTYTNDIIPSSKDAVNIAVSIYNGMEKSKEMSGLVPYAVFYDTHDEIWIVNFRNPNSEKMIGGDCNIALQKKMVKFYEYGLGNNP